MNLNDFNQLYTRISHDLANPMTALCNTTELLEMSDVSLAEVGDLLKESRFALLTRLLFFRQTFGVDCRSPDVSHDFLSTFGQKITLKGTVDNQLTRALLMVLADGLPRGGVIEIAPNTIKAFGAFARLSEDVIESLVNGKNAINPNTSIARFANEVALQSNYKISVDLQDDAIFLSWGV